MVVRVCARGSAQAFPLFTMANQKTAAEGGPDPGTYSAWVATITTILELCVTVITLWLTIVAAKDIVQGETDLGVLLGEAKTQHCIFKTTPSNHKEKIFNRATQKPFPDFDCALHTAPAGRCTLFLDSNESHSEFVPQRKYLALGNIDGHSKQCKEVHWPCAQPSDGSLPDSLRSQLCSAACTATPSTCEELNGMMNDGGCAAECTQQLKDYHLERMKCKPAGGHLCEGWGMPTGACGVSGTTYWTQIFTDDTCKTRAKNPDGQAMQIEKEKLNDFPGMHCVLLDTMAIFETDQCTINDVNANYRFGCRDDLKRLNGEKFMGTVLNTCGNYSICYDFRADGQPCDDVNPGHNQTETCFKRHLRDAQGILGEAANLVVISAIFQGLALFFQVSKDLLAHTRLEKVKKVSDNIGWGFARSDRVSFWVSSCVCGCVFRGRGGRVGSPPRHWEP